MLSNERIAYFNGKFVPESQVLIPFRDRGFKYGDAVFDTARTFGGKLFKLQEHLERLYRSLRYIGVEPGLGVAEMGAVTEQVVERNRHLLGADEDYWVTQRISRGIDRVAGETWPVDGPTVIVECTPLPLRARAALYRDGIDIVTPAVRRVPPDCLSPNVKSHNYLNLIVGDLEVRSRVPDGWAVLLDTRGFLCEGLGSNVFLASHGALYTPKVQYVLDGVSRQTVLELAREMAIPVQEADLTLYDAYTADEAFITSTSLCLCPMRSCNGKPIGTGQPPGPLTRRLTERYARLVDFDFVGQYLRYLPAASA